VHAKEKREKKRIENGKGGPRGEEVARRLTLYSRLSPINDVGKSVAREGGPGEGRVNRKNDREKRKGNFCGSKKLEPHSYSLLSQKCDDLPTRECG